MLLIDDETQSYWDHITGEAVHGPLLGAQLEVFPITHTTVAAALERDPEQQLRRSRSLSLYAKGFGLLHRRKIGRKGFIPPPFRATMAPADPRLPEQTQGVGVVHQGRAVFYPMSTLMAPLEVPWAEGVLRVGLDPLDGVPGASWPDGTRPFQVFARWYGFSLTYPGCEVFSG